MKKFISIISIIAVLAMSFSFTAFAANSNVYTVTTAKSAAAGEKICVQIELSGDFREVALVQYGIKYDAEKFSTVTTGRAPWGFNKEWYNSTKNENPENLGYISTPTFGEYPVGQLNIGFLSTDAYYIDDGGDLYGDNKTTIAGMIEFTALVDVASIDASCFELVNAKVEMEDGTAHAVTVNQIQAPGPVVTKVTPTAATLTGVADAMIEKGQAVAMTFNAGDIQNYAGMNWEVNFASGTKYAVVDYPASTIAALGATTPVQFVAAFLVYDRGYEAVDEISGVAAGFCNADKELAGLTATVEVE